MLHVLLGLSLLAAVDSTPRRTHTVCGIDRSGSAYPMIEDAVWECARVIAVAAPGDIVTVRWISHASYRAGEAVVHVALAAEPRRCRNMMDLSCRRAYADWQARLAAQKRSAISRLVGAAHSPARATDLGGFLQAASDLWAAEPPEIGRAVVIVTDLIENVHHAVAPALSGATVTVITLAVDGNVARARAARERAATLYRQFGAARVEFRPAMPRRP